MLAAIRAAGGEVYGITSEPHALASEAESAWELDFNIIGDPHLEIKAELKERGWLDVFHNTNSGHLRERSWTSHPNGYYQPAVIAVNRTQQVLYRWRCVPKYSNMSGAGGRPEAAYTWEKIQNIQSSDAHTRDTIVPLDQTPVLGSIDLSWPKFLLMLTGHGWFLRPRAFPLLRDGDKAGVTPKQAIQRWYYFLAAWLLAFAIFPFSWVAAGLLLWLILLAPGLIEIHKQFQNEPDPY